MVRKVSQIEILMKQKREIERNAGALQDDKTLQFAQELTNELLQDLRGVEGPRLSTIPEGEEVSDGDKSVDSSQRELDIAFQESLMSSHIQFHLIRFQQANPINKLSKPWDLFTLNNPLGMPKPIWPLHSTSAAVNSESEGNDFIDF